MLSLFNRRTTALWGTARPFRVLVTAAALCGPLAAAASPVSPFARNAKIPEQILADALNVHAPRPILHVLVRLRPDVAPAQLTRHFAASWAKLKNAVAPRDGEDASPITFKASNRQLGWHTFTLKSPQDLDDVVAALKNEPGVTAAEPDYHLKLAINTLPPPTDTYWNVVDLDHLIVVLSGLDTPSTARDDDSSTWTYTWNLDAVNALKAWSDYPQHYESAAERKYWWLHKPAKLPLVAVVDTGIDFSHQDFGYGPATPPGVINKWNDVSYGGEINFRLGRNVVSGNTSTNWQLAKDDFGHGTSVAGVIAAASNNGIGTIGLGFPAQIVPVKVIDASGNGDDSDLLDAFTYATDAHCVIINASLNVDTTQFPQSVQDAVDYCWNHGTLVIAAAGNDGNTGIPSLALTRRYPASCVHALAVGATAYGGPGTVSGERLASYSNYGLSLGVTAPGGDVTLFSNTSPNGSSLGLDPIQEYTLIWTLAPTYTVVLSDPTQPDGAYAALGLYGLNYGAVPGTSFATPHVAGLAALYASRYLITQSTPNAPQLLINAIEAGADAENTRADGGFGSQFGWGRINAFATGRHLNNRKATVGGLVGQVTFGTTVVNNVNVTAINSTTLKKYYATTFPDGIYHMVNLPAGNYTVSATVFGKSLSMLATVVAGCDQHGISLAL